MTKKNTKMTKQESKPLLQEEPRVDAIQDMLPLDSKKKQSWVLKESTELVPQALLDEGPGKMADEAPKEDPSITVPVQNLQVPPDAYKRIDVGALYVPFRDKLVQLVKNCAKRGAIYYVISGERTFDHQNKLYAQGRSAPGKIVTNAKGGQSAHNYCVAADLSRDKDTKKEGLQPDWDLDSYKILAEEAAKVGLEAAYYWKSFKEGPHVQLPLQKQGLTMQKLLEEYNRGGKWGVFRLLDRIAW